MGTQSEYPLFYEDPNGQQIYTVDIFFKLESLKRGYTSFTKGINQICKDAGFSYRVYVTLKEGKSFSNSYAELAKVFGFSYEFMRCIPINEIELKALRDNKFEFPLDADDDVTRIYKERKAHEIFSQLKTRK